jgi:hypothetical protein
MHSITVSLRSPCAFHPDTYKKYRTKKTKEETYDPKLVAAVEAKLRYLDVDTDAMYSDVETVR